LIEEQKIHHEGTKNTKKNKGDFFEGDRAKIEPKARDYEGVLRSKDSPRRHEGHEEGQRFH
jgi:hypothetical protein